MSKSGFNLMLDEIQNLLQLSVCLRKRPICFEKRCSGQSPTIGGAARGFRHESLDEVSLEDRQRKAMIC